MEHHDGLLGQRRRVRRELCQDDRHYLYKGQCIPFESREHTLTVTPAPTDPAGTPPRTIRMEVLRSVHGPIQAFDGRRAPVAIAEARSTYGHEIDSVVAYKRLNSGRGDEPATFQQAFGRENFAFNHFYVDERTSPTSPPAGTRGARRAPTRACPPGAPASGTGAAASPTASCRSRSTPKRGYFTNWNNKQAPGWRSADDNWAFGSLQRVQRLQKRVRAGIRGAQDDADRADEGDAGRRDGRPPRTGLLPAAAQGDRQAPAASVAEPLRLLDAWAREGGHRRDLDGDGVYEHGAAVALMDRWWERLMPGIFQPALGAPLVERIRAINPYAQTPDGQGSSFFDGWHGYVDKDLRRCSASA